MDRSDRNSPPSRRRFIDRLLGATTVGLLGSVAYPVIRYLIPPETAEASTSSVALDLPVDELARNAGRIFKFGTKPGILVRTPAGELRAFSAICTHLACTVQYRPDLQHIWCACHNGHFDLRGVNVAGPPPRPLEPYDVAERGGKVVVSRRA